MSYEQATTAAEGAKRRAAGRWVLGGMIAGGALFIAEERV
jgi:hypothetical protein